MEEVINICKIVHDDIGKGYSETIYQEAICILLRKNNIQYSKEVVLEKWFQDNFLGIIRSDIIIHQNLIIECKAIDGLLKKSHFPQLITYMEAAKIKNGIFVNFCQNPEQHVLDIYTAIKDTDDFYYFYKNTDNTVFFKYNSKGLFIKP